MGGILSTEEYIRKTAESLRLSNFAPKASKRLFGYLAWLAVADLLAILISFAIPWFYRIGMYGQPISTKYIIALGLFLAGYFFLSFSENAYSEDKFTTTRRALFQFLKIAVMTYGMLLLAAFVFKETGSFSRIWGATWSMLFFSYILLSRFYVARLMRQLAQRGVRTSRAIIVGNADSVASNYAALQRGNMAVEFVGFVCDASHSSANMLKHLGGLNELDILISQHDVDDVIIAVGWDHEDHINEIVRLASRKSVNIYLAPERMAPVGNVCEQRTIGSLSLIEVTRKPIDRWQALVKRVEDIVLSLAALSVLWPVMLLTAVLIKLESKGPVFFIQPRYGFNNELINVLKFRSMYTDMTDRNAEAQTTKDDPRVTRIGKFIRKTSIDELPQLLNVLGGSMSLVGPRPHATATKAAGKLFEEVVDNYAVRHRVKPGVTGWAQVNGWRGETDTEDKIKQRVECDIYYIRNWSLLLDLFILFKTVYVLFFEKDNAY